MNIGVCTNYQQAKLFIEDLIEKNNEVLERKYESKNKGEYITDKNWYRILTPNSHYARGMRFHKMYVGIENSADFIHEVLMPITILRKVDNVEIEIDNPIEFIVPNEVIFQCEYECNWMGGGNLDG